MVAVHVSVRYECTVAKLCKIGPRLLLITDRKLYTGFRMTYKLMILKAIACVLQQKTGHILEAMRDTA